MLYHQSIGGHIQQNEAEICCALFACKCATNMLSLLTSLLVIRRGATVSYIASIRFDHASVEFLIPSVGFLITVRCSYSAAMPPTD